MVGAAGWTVDCAAWLGLFKGPKGLHGLKGLWASLAGASVFACAAVGGLLGNSMVRVRRFQGWPFLICPKASARPGVSRARRRALRRPWAWRAVEDNSRM